MSAEYREALIAGAEPLGLTLDAELVRRLDVHFELVLRWAERINLTTITDPRLAASRHAIDCLLFTTMIPEAASWKTVDVGSGAGFPGIVLALARPALDMTLLEPIRKRASFLRFRSTELGLEKVRVVEGKLEAPGKDTPLPPRAAPLWPADLMISRATIPPLELVPLAGPRLVVGGRIILTSGAGAPSVDALAAAGASAGLVPRERKTFTLAGDETRILDWLERAR